MNRAENERLKVLERRLEGVDEKVDRLAEEVAGMKPILADIHDWVRARREEAEKKAAKARFDIAGVIKAIAMVLASFVSGWFGGKTS